MVGNRDLALSLVTRVDPLVQHIADTSLSCPQQNTNSKTLLRVRAEVHRSLSYGKRDQGWPTPANPSVRLRDDRLRSSQEHLPGRQPLRTRPRDRALCGGGRSPRDGWIGRERRA